MTFIKLIFSFNKNNTRHLLYAIPHQGEATKWLSSFLKIVLRKDHFPMCIQPFCIFVQKSESYFPRSITV